MGNVQASSIANQILPYEAYTAEITEIRYVQSLGSTRFMKVGRAEHAEGPVVIKIFVLVDQSFSVEPYREQMFQIRKRLKEHPNCCPFTRVYTTSRCAILCRPFQKFTLYDRLSTRPFLLDVEKRWIAFQLLKALGQCRIAMVCHGDIKSQNVLISSSNWVQITDFASFKPTFLPYDNPSVFTFFFDTSRRRGCNLAPERFKKSEDVNYTPRLPGEFLNISEGLTEAMDIFAMGCVLVELLTDGRHVAFTLSQAIDYKRMNQDDADLYLQKVLADVSGDFQGLLAVMLERNPTRRKEGFEKMLPCTSEIFPTAFESFIYRYMKEFQGTMEPDDIVTKLYVEQDNFLQHLEADNSDSVVLFIALVTSNIRVCKSLNAKMDAISLLQKLSKLTSPSVVADRIVPYLVHMLTDVFPQIRAEAIFVITEVLASFRLVPRDESRLLIDYVFPRLKSATCDLANMVKMALSSNLGQLATVALRFLEEGATEALHEEATMMADSQEKESEQALMRSERKALQETVNELFVNLCGSDNEVRQCLFERENLTRLCDFFGSSRAVDILMHMITLLNDKSDWRLRATFYDSCPIVARHVGQIRNSKLKPFLQQGLQDCEEFIIFKTLCCIYRLCDEKLLDTKAVCDLFGDVVPFLVHPNKWLRIAVVNILTVLDATFSVADVYCRLMPLVGRYLTEQLIRLNDKSVIYHCLSEPIPRKIWDIVVGNKYVADVIAELESRRTLDKLGGGRNSLFSATATTLNRPARIECYGQADKDSAVDSAVRKLSNNGLTEELEDKILAFKNILVKMESFRKLATSKSSAKTVIYLDDYDVQRRYFDFERGAMAMDSSKPIEVTSEWREVFSPNMHVTSVEGLGLMSTALDFGLDVSRNNGQHSDGTSRYSTSRFLLAEVLRHKRQRYLEQKRITAAAQQQDTQQALTTRQTRERASPHSSRSRPEIRLTSHLHEHAGAVTRLALHPDKDHFASCSVDKSIKIWSAKSIHRADHPAALSLETLRYSHKINCVSFMGHPDGHLAIATADCELILHDIHRKRVLKTFSQTDANGGGGIFDKERDGPIVDVHCSEHMIYALTHHSSLFCFDLRVGLNKRTAIHLEPVWKRKVRNSYGLVTSLSVDPLHQHWMVLTSSSTTTKNIVLWDLRFAGLEVSSWSHPSKQSIPLRSWPYVSEGQCRQVFTNCSREAELSLWDLGSQTRTDVLWPSSGEPLQYKHEAVTTSLVAYPGTDFVFTGQSDGTLRCWNLRNHERSNYLSGPYRKHTLPAMSLSGSDPLSEANLNSPRAEYMQIVTSDGLRIQREDRTQLKAARTSQMEAQRPLQVTDCHTDAVSDMLFTEPDALITAGREGVIKVWKSYNI